jgi:hypothetical protein
VRAAATLWATSRARTDLSKFNRRHVIWIQIHSADCCPLLGLAASLSGIPDGSHFSQDLPFTLLVLALLFNRITTKS